MNLERRHEMIDSNRDETNEKLRDMRSTFLELIAAKDKLHAMDLELELEMNKE